MDSFDYSAFAELFPSRQAGRYQRFDSAAEALRFVMEKIPPKARRGVTIEVSEDRFGFAEIEALYRASDFPLPRAGAAS